MLPKSLHSAIRDSKYYTASNDSLTFHAQTHRSRTANTDENRMKLTEEVSRVYREQVPSETSGDKKKRHGEMWVPLSPSLFKVVARLTLSTGSDLARRGSMNLGSSRRNSPAQRSSHAEDLWIEPSLPRPYRPAVFAPASGVRSTKGY